MKYGASTARGAGNAINAGLSKSHLRLRALCHERQVTCPRHFNNNLLSQEQSQHGKGETPIASLAGNARHTNRGRRRYRRLAAGRLAT